MDGCSQYWDCRLRSEGILPARQGHKVNCPKGKRESPGGYPCRATLRHVIPSGTCEFRCFAQFILADAVYSHQASELRNTVMLRLRRAADMCSSTVLTLRICGYIARKARPCGRKNPLPFPYFSQRSHVGNLRQTLQGKGVIHKRVETAGVYPLMLPRRVP